MSLKKSIIFLDVVFIMKEEKEKKKGVESRYTVNYTANPVKRVSVRSLSSFVDTSENNTEKNRIPRGQNLYTVGETGWFMDLFTNHSKPSSIGQKYLHCLANYSKSVVIGYPGRKLPSKLLKIVHKGKSLPLFRLEFIVNLLPG